jgi:hypothetical protein
VISYSDEIQNGLGPSAWREADRRLVDALHTIGREFGDQVHTSGSADYLVRFLVNVTDITVQERVRNYFLVLVSGEGIDTVTKIGDEELSREGPLTFEESWVDEICNRFRAFRERLAR